MPMPTPQNQPPPLRNKIVSGALWLVGTRWLIRVLGLLSTMILARILMPEDFGVVAAVTAVVAILDGFFDFGFNLALMRAAEFKREEYDTAWTLRAIKSTAFAAVLAGLSPFIAAYAGDVNLIAVSIVVAVSVIVRGSENIGIVQFEKELKYDRLLLIRLYPRLVGFIVTLWLAWWLKSYWAIVYGVLVQQTASTGFSYILCKFRPRFRLQGSAKLWDFSRWIVVSSISRQVYASVDRLALSGLVSKRDLGYFSVGSSVAAMVSTELVGAAGAALIPGYAKLKDDLVRLRAAFLVSQGALIGLLLPVSATVVLVSEPLSLLVLGPNWGGVAPILSGFAIFYAIYTITENLTGFMAIVDLQRWAAKVGVVRTLMFLVLVYPAFLMGGIIGIITLKVGLSMIELILLLMRCVERLDCIIYNYMSQILRPALGLVLMIPVILVVGVVNFDYPVVHVLAAVCAGMFTYGVTIFSVWHLSGRPHGLEQLVLEGIQRIASRFSR